MYGSLSISAQALDTAQRKAGYTSLEHSVPVLCFGEGKDLELSLCAESNSLPLATQVFHNVDQCTLLTLTDCKHRWAPFQHLGNTGHACTHSCRSCARYIRVHILSGHILMCR